MAVRHGYGKIAGTDALVFAYDTGDTRNSYKGKPTTNLFLRGHFPGGADMPAEGGSNPTNEIILLPNNPGASDYVLSQPAGYTSTEYQISLFSTLAANTTYVMSGWYGESADYSGVSRMFHSRAYSSGGSHVSTGYGIGTTLKTVVLGGITWRYVYQTITTPADATGTFNWYVGYGNDAYSGTRYYTNLMMEVGTTPSQFVNGTRSATQGLLDLTGNKSINLTNVSFDSNAQKDFDGSSDFLTINIVDEIYDSDYSVEAIFKRDVSGVSHGIITDLQYGWWRLKITSANTLYWNHKLNDSNINQLYSNSTIGTAWTHVIVTFSKTDGAKMYINGELDNSNSDTRIFGLTSGRGPQYIGYSRNGAPSSPSEYFNGKIPVVKICLKTLTADEVRNNYRHYKKRFNI